MADLPNLIPAELKRPASAEAASVPVPAQAVPKFGRPAMLMPDNFWSNLKQFLFERPIKVRGDFKSPLMPDQYGGGVGGNLKEFFSSAPVPKVQINGRFAVSRVANFGGFGERLKEFFSPTKAAPLPAGITPVKVKDIWSKDENFGWSQIIAFGAHGVLLFVLLFVPLFFANLMPSTEAKSKVDVTPLDISPYLAKLPSGENKAGGGGGANDHTLAPVNKGKLPKFKMTQFTPPQVKPFENPKLPMDPSLLAPPDLKVANNPNLPTFGDPLATGNSESLGHGNGTGIGSGNGGGLGPGEGGGTGGGAFRAGVNGVGSPVCIYCPLPEYSDEARKAKYQGSVTLDVLVTIDGRVMSPVVVKGPGLGLEEKAMAQVKNWKLKPAIGPNGKPVNARVIIEVAFRIF